ncbi:MAG: hypothetical protein ACRBB3_03935 [Alphaproteobacteria bacterium]
MKITQKLSFIMIATLCMLSSIPYANSAENVKMYGVKSGILESKIEQTMYGKTTIIHETTVWDNWGLKLAKYQTTEKLGTKSIILYSNKNGRIFLDKSYLVQLKDMSYKETPTLSQGLLAKLTDNDQQNVAQAMAEKGGNKKSGETKIWDGKECEVWVHPAGNKNCLWNGLILYTEISPADFYKSIKTPVKFSEQPVDPSYFNVPGLAAPE